MNEDNALKELQSFASTPYYQPIKVEQLDCKKYLEKCIYQIYNCPYQLLKKDPTTKIKTKTLPELKSQLLKGN